MLLSKLNVHWHKMNDNRCNLSKYIALKQTLSDVQLLIMPYLSISILVQLRYNQSVLIEFKILFI